MGESHGNFEGLTREQDKEHSHFLQYQRLPSKERILCPWKKKGKVKLMSGAELFLYYKISVANISGETVIVITHAGVLDFLSFLLGDDSPEHIHSVPQGQFIHLFGDGSTLFYADDQEY